MKRTVSVLLCLVLLLGVGAFAEGWFCPKCGNENDGNFCTACGEKRPEDIVCPSCGEAYAFDSGYAFCPNCGAALREDDAEGEVTVGDIITFGQYEQDGDASNGAEPIEWIVLDTDGETATLISRYALEAKPYHEEFEDITWETCTLRAWLNGAFFEQAFSEAEQQQIELVTNENPDNSEYGTAGGNDTQDRVYLLSSDEGERYFASDDDGMAEATVHAIQNGVWVVTEEDSKDYGIDEKMIGYCWWWLRWPVVFSDGATCAYAVSGINLMRSFVNHNEYAVRPVVVLRLS